MLRYVEQVMERLVSVSTVLGIASIFPAHLSLRSQPAVSGYVDESRLAEETKRMLLKSGTSGSDRALRFGGIWSKLEKGVCGVSMSL